jgi:surface protein
MDLYLNLMPDLRNIVTGYFGDVIFLQGDKVEVSQGDEVNEVTFATAEEFKKSKAVDCHFINFEITSTDHINNPDIPKTLLRCSGIPKIKTHTLAWMFEDLKFNGDISQWDVSNVTNMNFMFNTSQFNGDISQWDVSSVTNMLCMFAYSQFNNNLLTWDVSSVTNISFMFNNARFNGDISQWDVSSATDMAGMFADSEFNGDLSQWDVSNVAKMYYTFVRSGLDKETVQSWDNFKNHNINRMFN